MSVVRENGWMWPAQQRLKSVLSITYGADRAVEVPFRRTFRVNYDGHNDQKVHVSLHVKDRAQLDEMSEFFTALRFEKNEIPISKMNKYPVPHLKLTPDAEIYSCACCFFITIILYPRDVDYAKALVRFKQSYGRSIREKHTRKTPPHVSVSTTSHEAWERIGDYVDSHTNYAYTKIFKPDEDTLNILLPNGSLFEISSPREVARRGVRQGRLLDE